MKPRRYDTVDLLEYEFLWDKRILRGSPTYLVGPKKTGKGLVIADLIARVTNGDDWPDGSPAEVDPGMVLTITPEDDPESVMKPRLMAAGANMELVADMTSGFGIPSSLPDLMEAIRDFKNVRMVLMDPLSSVSDIHLGSGPVTIRRELTNPLEALCKATGIALVMVLHPNKDNKTVQGSGAITDAARMVLSVRRLKSDPRTRVLSVDMTNTGDGDSTPDIGYMITGKGASTHVQYLDIPADPMETGSAANAAKIANNGPSGPSRILVALLTAPPEGLGPQDIAMAADIDYVNARVASGRHVDAGNAVLVKRGKYALTPKGRKEAEETLALMETVKGGATLTAA